MKKEELFDLLEDVDRKYISEAMFDDLDGDSPAVARPGKAKISPLKIIAPIAACMAVVIGTGAVVSRLNKPKTDENSDQQSVQEQIDPKAFIQVDFREKDLMAIYDSNTIELDFEPEELDCEFIAECISRIKDEYEDAQQDDVTWYVRKARSLCHNAVRDFYFQPRIDGQVIPDVGIRVFHKTKGYSSIYGETFDLWDHGAFGQGCKTLELNALVDDFNNSERYYYNTETIGSAESTRLREVYINGNKDEIVEKTLLEKYDDGDTVTYLHEGKKITEEEFIGIWNTYPYIPKFYTEFTTEEVDECREALKESLGLTDNARKESWRDAEVDIDLDGTKELLLSLTEEDGNSRWSYDVHVFARTSDGIRDVGSFDMGRFVNEPETIRYRNVSATEHFPYFYDYDYYFTNSSYGQGYVKILVDENGNIYTEFFAGKIRETIDGEWVEHYEMYGKEVTYEEYYNATRNYQIYSNDHEYHKPSVPTNPDNYAWD